MGVKGLQSFLKRNESYFSDISILNDTCLVIDGNNLCFQTFSQIVQDSSSPYYNTQVYGGDLVHYSSEVREFFSNLEKCNITPILVFDGSTIGKSSMKDYIATKEKEIHKRNLKKFELAKSASEDSGGQDIMLPRIIKEIFRNITNDLNIKRIQAVYEADTHIARLANENDCPVLTNDSDFIIYELKRGFILLDSFEHKNPVRDRNGRLGIKCSLFSQAKLCKSIPGLRPECLPLLSVILGNDYVESSTFDLLCKTICNRPYQGYLVVSSFTHRRIANLLMWLGGRTLDESLEYIIGFVPERYQTRLRNLFRMLIRNYHIEEIDDFDSELNAIYCSAKRTNDPQIPHPTEHLKRMMLIDNLGSVALDMIMHNTHYNQSIGDDIGLPSSCSVKFRPFSLALVLLRPQAYTNLTKDRIEELIKRDSFHIWDRVEREYTELILKPLDKLENFGSLEHLDCHSMIALEPHMKKNMLMACYRFNSDEYDRILDTASMVFDGTWAKEVTICMIIVNYIGLETKSKPNPQFVDALLLTFFYYAACAAGLNESNVPPAEIYEHLLLELRKHSMKDKEGQLCDRDLFKRILHFISQLQQAFYSYSVVNSLLGHPFHQTRQGTFMNCTMIFRLTKSLRQKRQKLDVLCEDIPTFLDLCDTMKTLVHC